jgi:hypothetical protein
MAELLVINNSYICNMQQDSIVTSVAVNSEEWADFKINGGSNMTSRDLWGKVFVICLQRVGIFLKGK